MAKDGVPCRASQGCALIVRECYVTESDNHQQPDRESLARAVIARYTAIVDDPQALLGALLRPIPVTLWANPLRLNRDSLLELLRADGFRADAMDWSAAGIRLSPDARPGRHWGFLAGLFQVQEEVSMLPVMLLDPRPGERVLDLCAAPGNKTAQMALAMNNLGTVIANDLRKGRLAAMRQTIKRLGLLNVAITARDGQSLGGEIGGFDRVLVDAPCSCEGTFRKVANPTVSTERFRMSRAATQARLLEKAVRLTRPGGRIVYSTCTLAPEENEAVVDTVLHRYPGTLRVVPMSVPGLKAASGITAWQQRVFDPSLSQTLRLWPHHNDTGGFFVAVLERTDAADPPPEGKRFRPSNEAVDALAPLTDRFGIDSEAFSGAGAVAWSNKHVCLAPRDHDYPASPMPDSLGLPAVRRRSLPVKPTTAAALLYGDQAVRNLVPLDTDQLRVYLDREPIHHPREDQLAACTGPGHVLLRYQGYTVGLGQLIFDRATGVPRIASLMPKAWSRDAVSLGPAEEG